MRVADVQQVNMVITPDELAIGFDRRCTSQVDVFQLDNLHVLPFPLDGLHEFRDLRLRDSL